jgi:hypothetical protein
MKRVLTAILALVVMVFGSPWQGAKMVWQTDTTDRPCMDNGLLTSDAGGWPWLLWARFNVHNPDSTRLLEISRWNGSHWVEPERLPDTIKYDGGYCDGVFVPNSKLWFIYPMRPSGNYSDIWSAQYDPGTALWDLPTQVNAPDTNSLDDFYPRIDIGGGQVWAVWFNEVGSRAICDIKASHWNDSTLSWGPEMTVNPDTGGINRMEWFPDVAVDDGGTPYVVWTCSRPDENTSLLCSSYDNGHWTAPESVCNPDSVIVSGPYGGTRPRLVDDIEGNLHLAVLGARPGDTVVGLYYSCRAAGKWSWSEPVRTDTWSTTGNPIWDKDLAVGGPDNIWVAFDRGGGRDWMVFAQHFDGQSWTPEQRIDDGMTYEGGFPEIALDGDGLPFVAWSADSSETMYKNQIWYNRYSLSGQAEQPGRSFTTRQLGATVVSGVLFLPETPGHKHQAAGLLDISGRREMDLHPGVNDVRALAPGSTSSGRQGPKLKRK